MVLGGFPMTIEVENTVVSLQTGRQIPSDKKNYIQAKWLAGNQIDGTVNLTTKGVKTQEPATGYALFSCTSLLTARKVG
jgi:hypothetical protein